MKRKRLSAFFSSTWWGNFAFGQGYDNRELSFPPRQLFEFPGTHSRQLLYCTIFFRLYSIFVATHLQSKMASSQKREHNFSCYTLSESRRDRVFLACGPVALLFVFVFFVASGFLPPMSPLLTLQDLGGHYEQNRDNINNGVVVLLLASCLWPLFGAGINSQLSRIPRINITILILQMTGSCLLGFALALIGTFFATAAYRSGRDPVITQLASDLAWLLYMSIGTPMILQSFAISWAIFSDDREKPLVPYWVGWTSFLISGWAIPTEFVAHCFHDGPLAWDGVTSFWIPWLWGAVSYGTLFFSLWQASGLVTEKKVLWALELRVWFKVTGAERDILLVKSWNFCLENLAALL